MFAHHLIAAFRTLRRFKASSLVSVLGLAVGLACFIAAYGAVIYLTNGDRQLKNIDRIFLIEGRAFRNDPVGGYDTGFFPYGPNWAGAAEELRAEFPDLSAIAIFSPLPGMPLGVGGRKDFADAAWADPAFLEMFELPFIRSDSANPLSRSREAVLTADAALRLFGTTAVLGRVLTLDGALDVTIGGVLRSFPRTSFFRTPTSPGFADTAFGFELLISRATYRDLQAALKRPASFGGPYIYAMLPGSSALTVGAFNARLRGLSHRLGHDSPIQQWEYRAVPVAGLRLEALERTLFNLHPGVPLVAVVMGLAGAVLGTACFNYAILALAQSLARSREIGIRAVLGAGRLDTAVQHLTEAVLKTGLAALIAFAMLAAFALALDAHTGLDLLGTVATSARFWVCTVSVSLAVTLVSGLYPAVHLASLHPVRALRAGHALATPRTVSSTVIGAQFALAGLLLTALAVVQRENTGLRKTGLPASASETLILGPGWSASGASLETWRRALADHPAIESVAAISRTPWSESLGNGEFLVAHPGATRVEAVITLVSPDFRAALGMRLLAGRAFDLPAERTAANDIVINRALAAALGFASPQAAIGQILYEEPPDQPVSGTVRIAGVIENEPLRILSLFGQRAYLYRLMTPQQQRGSSLIVRVSGRALPQALAAIDGAWRQLANMPIEREFMDDFFERAYRSYAGIGLALTVLAGVGCLVAMMGVFGVALFVAERRTHEIGVRKAIGARPGQILSMLLVEFSKPVVIANLCIWPVAYVAARAYLNLFAERVPLSPLPFVGSLVLALLLAYFAVGGQALRAARTRPATVLQHE